MIARSGTCIRASAKPSAAVEACRMSALSERSAPEGDAHVVVVIDDEDPGLKRWAGL